MHREPYVPLLPLTPPCTPSLPLLTPLHTLYTPFTHPLHPLEPPCSLRCDFFTECLAERRVELCEGARVILLANLDLDAEGEQKLCNGSLGLVGPPPPPHEVRWPRANTPSSPTLVSPPRRPRPPSHPLESVTHPLTHPQVMAAVDAKLGELAEKQQQVQEQLNGGGSERSRDSLLARVRFLRLSP